MHDTWLAMVDGVVGTLGSPLAAYAPARREVLVAGVYAGSGPGQRPAAGPGLDAPGRGTRARRRTCGACSTCAPASLHHEARSTIGAFRAVTFASRARPGVGVLRADGRGGACRRGAPFLAPDDHARQVRRDGCTRGRGATARRARVLPRRPASPGGVAVAASQVARGRAGRTTPRAARGLRDATRPAADRRTWRAEHLASRARPRVSTGSARAARGLGASLGGDGHPHRRRRGPPARRELRPVPSRRLDRPDPPGAPRPARPLGPRLQGPRLLGLGGLRAALLRRHPTGRGASDAGLPGPAARGRPGSRTRGGPAWRLVPVGVGRRRARRDAAVGARARRRSPIRVWTGERELHVVADIAWAAAEYVAWSGDDRLRGPEGRRLLIETARFWASRLERDADGSVHLRGIIGPDEYHELVDDNAYTNVMARWNLRAAAASRRASGLRESGRHAGAQDDCAGEPSARGGRRLAAFADRIVDGYDPGPASTSSSPASTASSPSASRRWHRVPPGRMSSSAASGSPGHRSSSRPTCCSSTTSCPARWRRARWRPNLDYYEPRTAHGSSLSPATHAALLARAGRLRAGPRSPAHGRLHRPRRPQRHGLRGPPRPDHGRALAGPGDGLRRHPPGRRRAGHRSPPAAGLGAPRGPGALPWAPRPSHRRAWLDDHPQQRARSRSSCPASRR